MKNWQEEGRVMAEPGVGLMEPAPSTVTISDERQSGANQAPDKAVGELQRCTVILWDCDYCFRGTVGFGDSTHK